MGNPVLRLRVGLFVHDRFQMREVECLVRVLPDPGHALADLLGREAMVVDPPLLRSASEHSNFRDRLHGDRRGPREVLLERAFDARSRSEPPLPRVPRILILGPLASLDS